MRNKSLKYIYSIVPVVVVAALGSIFVGLGMEWYKSLNKPSIWIPDAVIPIMWTIIYLLVIAILIMILDKRKLDKKTTILLVVNGVLNVLWCLVFFTMKNPLLGQVVIIGNLLSAYLLDYNLMEYKKEYGCALLIYPLWVSVATSLNLVLWTLN